MKRTNIVISVVSLVLLFFGNGSCSTNSAITAVETAIGTSEPENSNTILSVRVQRNFLAWGPWHPPLTTNQIRVVVHSFEKDIICVSSEVDATGLRSLHFSRRNGNITLVRSYFPGQYPLSPCCDSNFFSFSFKGYPLSNLSIDSSYSKIKPAWKQPSIERNDLVVLDSGNGILKQYLIKTDNDSSPTHDTCYWSDRSDFLSAGRINKIELELGSWPYWTYHMALSVKYGRSWRSHGHYKNDLEKYLLNVENITGFVYDYNKEVVAFSTQQRNYTFGDGYAIYRRLTLFGKECTVAFFTGYNTMYRKPQEPWLIYTERLFINGTIMLIDPYWLCEIPNKICEKNSNDLYVCACTEGYIADGDLCIKACSSLIPDGYFGMEILENTKCPIHPQSVCSVENCLNITVNFTCHEGEWVPINPDATKLSTRSIAVINCHRSCYFDPNAEECVTNENREKTPEVIEKMLNDSIDQVLEAIAFCYENHEECSERTFKCYNGEGVILMTKVCDRVKDCTDASDEICGADKGINFGLGGLFASLTGFLNIFNTFVSDGTLPHPGEDVPDEGEGSKCEWTSWEEIGDECDLMCGKAGREGKTEVRFRHGEKCVPARETRMRSCEEDNICLSCAKPTCQVDVHFKNFQEPYSSTDLRQHITAKSEGGKVSFSTSFTSDEICSCEITDEHYLLCKAKKKGTEIFIVTAQNEADEELALTINVTIGDYPVEFIKDRLVFENFLESQTVNATDLARDEDVEDIIEFTRVELSADPGEDILIRLEKKITSLYFQIGEFVGGEISCSITVTSGGYVATSTVQLIVGKELRCPICKLGDTLCKEKIIYEYYDFDSLQTIEGNERFFQPKAIPRKRVHVAGGKVGGKVPKRFTVIQGCDLPYNQYFKRWLKQFDMEFEPYPLISDTPYVLADSSATVIYRKNSTNTEIFVDSQAKYLAEITAIYDKGVLKMKNVTRTFIDMLHELNIIGFASIYKLKPTGVSEKLNIQFDHIPPKSAKPASIPEGDFSNNAPTLAISNFDHRSEVWKNCSTGNKVTTPILNLYNSFMGEYNYSCAIFANIKCIRDEELKASKNKRLYDDDNKTAFKRYRQGLKGLVNLHFDYGINFNYACKVARISSAARPHSAYCEIKQPDFPTPNIECAKHSTCVEEIFKNQTYYYVKNIPNKQSQCIKLKIKTERNILREDRELLTKFIDGHTATAEKELWEKCCTQSPLDCSLYLHKPV